MYAPNPLNMVDSRFAVDNIENPTIRNMASKQTPKSQQSQQDISAAQPKQIKRRKKNTIKNQFAYGDNKISFEVSPKFLAAIIGAVMTMLGVSTNLVFQARNQNSALPSSQRVVENPRD
jgi:hypothetical protein